MSFRDICIFSRAVSYKLAYQNGGPNNRCGLNWGETFDWHRVFDFANQSNVSLWLLWIAFTYQNQKAWKLPFKATSLHITDSHCTLVTLHIANNRNTYKVYITDSHSNCIYRRFTVSECVAHIVFYATIFKMKWRRQSRDKGGSFSKPAICSKISIHGLRICIANTAIQPPSRNVLRYPRWIQCACVCVYLMQCHSRIKTGERLRFSSNTCSIGPQLQ